MSQSGRVVDWAWSYCNPFHSYAEVVKAIDEQEVANPDRERLLARLRLGGRLLDSAVTWFGGRDLGEDLAMRMIAANLQLHPQLPIHQRSISSVGMTLASHAQALATTYLFNTVIAALF